MAIALNEIDLLESNLNSKFSSKGLAFKMSLHFVRDRMNDPRNQPSIRLHELDRIFNRLVIVHLGKLLMLNQNDTFNIKCIASDINIPCGIDISFITENEIIRTIVAITIMRKKSFISKDALVLEV